MICVRDFNFTMGVRLHPLLFTNDRFVCFLHYDPFSWIIPPMRITYIVALFSPFLRCLNLAHGISVINAGTVVGWVFDYGLDSHITPFLIRISPATSLWAGNII